MPSLKWSFNFKYLIAICQASHFFCWMLLVRSGRYKDTCMTYNSTKLPLISLQVRSHALLSHASPLHYPLSLYEYHPGSSIPPLYPPPVSPIPQANSCAIPCSTWMTLSFIWLMVPPILLATYIASIKCYMNCIEIYAGLGG